jgi:hypothetical protein
LEITVSFLEINKWDPDIYIGFSKALHLQCTERSRLQREGKDRVNIGDWLCSVLYNLFNREGSSLVETNGS